MLAKIFIDVSTIKGVINEVREKGRQFLLVPEAMRVMEAAGIPMPKSYVAKNIKEAIEYAEHIGYPVVMKIVSKDIIHKSDAGGVALNLDNREEIIDAYEAIMNSCRSYKPDAEIQGVEIVTMIKMDEAKCEQREPVIKDCYHKLEDATKMLVKIEDNIDEILNILDGDFDIFDRPTSITDKKGPHKNLRFGLAIIYKGTSHL